MDATAELGWAGLGYSYGTADMNSGGTAIILLFLRKDFIS